ncbi:Hypothetical protein D9617_8g050910 [Elsinoe fawcettii]|nr:Hypothetical protein D9617_8g050910 [Elsinoe fawcettii]
MDSWDDTETAILSILEITIYLAIWQTTLVKKQGRDQPSLLHFAIFFTTVLLHLGQRRLVFPADSRPDVIFHEWFMPHTSQSSLEAGGDTDYYRPETAISPSLNVSPAPLNVTNAISLHNRIVSHALKQLPYAAQHIKTNYFTIHDATDILPRLSPTTIEFLEGINVWDINRFALSPTLCSPPWPSELSPDPDKDESQWMWYDSYPEGVLLYGAGDFSYDDRGLVLDQRTNMVRLYPWTDVGSPQKQPWVPLELALELMLREVEEARVVIGQDAMAKAGPSTSEEMGRDLWFESIWERKKWLPKDVDRAVGMWEAYLAIVGVKTGRMVSGPESMVSQEVVESLSLGIWARALLPRLRRPVFEFVAPGLKLADEQMLVKTSETDRKRRRIKEHEWEDEREPVTLLFYSDTRFSNLSWAESDRRWVAPWFAKHRVLDDRCGIYMGNADDDSLSFIVPGTDRYGESDELVVRFKQPWGLFRGSLLNETEEVLFDAVHAGSSLRFHHLIAGWADHVLSGAWSVGVNGVEGDLDDLRK